MIAELVACQPSCTHTTRACSPVLPWLAYLMLQPAKSRPSSPALMTSGWLTCPYATRASSIVLQPVRGRASFLPPAGDRGQGASFPGQWLTRLLQLFLRFNFFSLLCLFRRKSIFFPFQGSVTLISLRLWCLSLLCNCLCHFHKFS